jgi:glutathione S-transferase
MLGRLLRRCPRASRGRAIPWQHGASFSATGEIGHDLAVLEVSPDAALAGRSFVMDEPTIADLALFPVAAHRRSLIEKAGGHRHLLAWIDRMAARPGVARGLASAR